jgi:hypothetical protein
MAPSLPNSSTYLLCAKDLSGNRSLACSLTPTLAATRAGRQLSWAKVRLLRCFCMVQMIIEYLGCCPRTDFEENHACLKVTDSGTN